MIGKKILSYEVKELLGEGGMGNVYLAEHVINGEKAAIKSLLPQLVRHESLRQRFKTEAETMSRLKHDNIVKLLGYIEDGDGAYIIMEYVEGKDLSKYIKNETGPIPADQALPMMKQILNAFAFAHQHDVIHRDIKPSNILLTKDGQIKIIDFGIAKVTSEADRKLTKTGLQMGAAYYMSPEQVKGKTVDKRTDIYSLGVTFFQMVTGQSPYESLTTEYEIYQKIVHDPLPSAKSIYPSADSEFDKVIAKATAKDPGLRFDDCAQFTEALAGAATASPVNTGTKPKPARKRIHPALIAGILLFAFLLGMLIWQLTASSRYKKLMSEASSSFYAQDYITAINTYRKALAKRNSLLFGRGDEDPEEKIKDSWFELYKNQGEDELKKDKFSLDDSTGYRFKALETFNTAKTFRPDDDYVNNRIKLCEIIQEGINYYKNSDFKSSRSSYDNAAIYAKEINADPLTLTHLHEVRAYVSSPAADFIYSWAEPNVYTDNYSRGVKIHFRFKTRFLKYEYCKLVMWFYDSDGNRLENYYYRPYEFTNTFIPTDDFKTFEDHFFNFSYDNLYITYTGTYRFDARIYYGNELLATSSTESFYAIIY
jgi:tRNA A-37 threonylcarbamoyl transferase component Bud32